MKVIPNYPKSLFPEPNALPWNFRQFLRIFWRLWRLPSVWWQHSRYSPMFPNPAQCHPLLTPSQRSFHTKNRRFYPKSCPWQLQGWALPNGNSGYSGITPWTQGDSPRAGNSRLLLPKAGGLFFSPLKTDIWSLGSNCAEAGKCSWKSIQGNTRMGNRTMFVHRGKRPQISFFCQQNSTLGSASLGGGKNHLGQVMKSQIFFIQKGFSSHGKSWFLHDLHHNRIVSPQKEIFGPFWAFPWVLVEGKQLQLGFIVPQREGNWKLMEINWNKWKSSWVPSKVHTRT